MKLQPGVSVFAVPIKDYYLIMANIDSMQLFLKLYQIGLNVACLKGWLDRNLLVKRTSGKLM